MLRREIGVSKKKCPRTRVQTELHSRKVSCNDADLLLNGQQATYLEDDKTVFAATEVHSRLTLNARLARNHNTNKTELIFAISLTVAICNVAMGRWEKKQNAKTWLTRGAAKRECS